MDARPFADCACCGAYAEIHARSLCKRCYVRFRKSPNAHPGWKERYPTVEERHYRPSLPAEPILEIVKARGGFTEVANRVGLPSRSNERERLSLALRRGARRGHFPIATADTIAIKLLDLVLDNIPGYDVA